MFLCAKSWAVDKFSLIFVLSLPFAGFNFVLFLGNVALASTSFPSSKDMPLIGRLSITQTIIRQVFHFDVSSTSHKGISIFFPSIPLMVNFWRLFLWRLFFGATFWCSFFEENWLGGSRISQYGYWYLLLLSSKYITFSYKWAISLVYFHNGRSLLACSLDSAELWRKKS